MTTTKWKESADFWRERANKFELALRQIEACYNYGNIEDTNSERWEIAFKALEESKKSSEV